MFSVTDITKIRIVADFNRVLAILLLHILSVALRIKLQGYRYVIL
jgi:hypothetical protein